MDDFHPLRNAAELAGVDRNSISRWVKEGLLKSRKGKVRNLQTTLVSVAAVKALAAKRKPGRPRKSEAM